MSVGGFTVEEWAFEARQLRDALAAIGEFVPHCLPGEEKDCGASAEDHYTTYVLMLKAKAHVMAEVNITRDRDYWLGEAYDGMVEDFREHAQ